VDPTLPVGCEAPNPHPAKQQNPHRFDNESIAVTAIVLTFFLWTRALRTPSSWVLWSPLAALAYVYMVAAWGGYTFVLNMVGLHVTALVFLGRFTPSLHHAYTVFMLIGTYGAIQFPVVGLKPLRDMEHMGPLVMCLVLQVFIRRPKSPPLVQCQRDVEELPTTVRGFPPPSCGGWTYVCEVSCPQYQTYQCYAQVLVLGALRFPSVGWSSVPQRPASQPTNNSNLDAERLGSASSNRLHFALPGDSAVVSLSPVRGRLSTASQGNKVG
jgi:hypothetical protein